MQGQAPIHTPKTSAPAAQVLLVEDDEDLREGLAENLRLKGMDVYEAATGSEFRVTMAAVEIDVAIIDVNLPDASGFDLARELMDVGNRPGIVILTARSARQDRLQGYTDGADLYMTKPVHNEELVLAVRNLAARIAHSRTGHRRQTDTKVWKLNVARKILISPDGKFLILTGKEVMLLEMFARVGDKPLSRTHVSSVMGYGTPGQQNRGLDAALRRLKEKAIQQGIELPVVVVYSIGIRFVGSIVTTEDLTAG